MSNFSVIEKNLKKRYIRESVFKFFGLLSVLFGVVFLSFLFFSIISKGYTAFEQTNIEFEITYDAELLEIDDPTDQDQLLEADFADVVEVAFVKRFPETESLDDPRELLNELISDRTDYQLRQKLEADPSLLGKTVKVWVLASDIVDGYVKGNIDMTKPEKDRLIKDSQIKFIDALKKTGELKLKFNKLFFTGGDSSHPEQAGILGALKGSFFTLLVTLALSFPIGVAAAVYLEEFAPQNKWTDLIEVNINNLAAVPSIIFGLLGLAVFLNLFGLPRSAPLVGGMVLSLMTLPTIIISSRAALKSVPPSIREAAMGMGASPMQVVTHHVLPLAMPGMLTGTIIGMAQALGETAPLLMIGMVAFIVDVPNGFTDPSSVLPVQIYSLSDKPELGFKEKAPAIIMVLLGFLICMNAFAVYLRKKFERRW